MGAKKIQAKDAENQNKYQELNIAAIANYDATVDKAHTKFKGVEQATQSAREQAEKKFNAAITAEGEAYTKATTDYDEAHAAALKKYEANQKAADTKYNNDNQKTADTKVAAEKERDDAMKLFDQKIIDAEVVRQKTLERANDAHLAADKANQQVLKEMTKQLYSQPQQSSSAGAAAADGAAAAKKGGKGGDGKAGSNNAGKVKDVDGWDGIPRGGEKGGKDSGTKAAGAAVVPATGARLLRGKNGPPTAANGGLSAGTMGGSVR